MVLQKFDDGDLLLCRITSKIYTSEFDVVIADWEASGLLLNSVVRVHKVIVVESLVIDQKIGEVSNLVFNQVCGIFSRIVKKKGEQ